MGHLGLSSSSVKAEQVACGWGLGLSPSEQGCAGSHILSLQVPGGLQPLEEKVVKDMGMRPILAALHLLTHCHTPGSTRGESDAGWGREVGAPQAAHSGSVVGVEDEVTQRVVHCTAWC